MYSSVYKINIEDKAVFKSLFNDFFVTLCLFAERYVEEPEMAADIVDESFVNLWQIRKNFNYLHQVKSFLYVSVRNLALNEIKHKRVEEAYRDWAGEGFRLWREEVIEEESYRLLMQAIQKLPAQCRRVIMLAMEGKANKEIAEELGISDGTVHSLKKTAYRRLREELKHYFYLIIFLMHIVQKKNCKKNYF